MSLSVSRPKPEELHSLLGVSLSAAVAARAGNFSKGLLKRSKAVELTFKEVDKETKVF